jgi:tRNA-splicing ligase RtcB
MNLLLEIVNLLAEFGVNVNKIYRQKGVRNSYGEETHKLSLRISAKLDNLLNLWGKIGYEYCEERKELSMLALAYLKYKINFLAKLKKFIQRVKELKENGISTSEIFVEATSRGISKSFVGGQLYQKRLGLRITQNFPAFEEFVQVHKIENSEFVLDEIEEITELRYDGFVYDFTMNDTNHNFIANSIVSHNCGMRLIKTDLTWDDVKPKLKPLVDTLFKLVPAGVGAHGFVKLTQQQHKEVMVDGTKWCVKNGYGWEEDVARTEDEGAIEGADPSKVSEKAIKRGSPELGTLGSGNHYLEVQVVKPENIFNETLAKKLGIFENQVCVMVHCGSRGFGHQICTDYVANFLPKMNGWGIKVRDQELACAPFRTKEAQDYLAAMRCAANYAFANRQLILHRIREGFSQVFGQDAEKLGMHLIYDVAHNTAKVEKHKIDGKDQELVMHRKGATRCFGPARKEVPKLYKETGQPVIVGGSMETGSFLCVGTDHAEHETFGSTMHGSGRTMSRTQAKRTFRGTDLQKKMQEHGIYVHAVSMSELAEEAGGAYKDINEVVDTMEIAGVSKKVCRFLPVGNVKG